MLIQCTKALLDKLGLKNENLVSSLGHEDFPNSLFAWHANFVSIGRKKAIVLMNNESRYSVVIYRPGKKDFSNIKELICSAIREALRMEGVHKEVIETYMEKAGEITFSKTANRSLVAKMNNAVREIEFYQEYLNENTRIQRYISMRTGRLIQLDGPNAGFYPIEKMIDSLNKLVDGHGNIPTENILDIDLYQLKIRIELEHHDIWRRILVPSTYSFRHLHHIIQTVFDWQNYHLHEFFVDRVGAKTINIVMNDDPETVEFMDADEFDVRQERFVELQDIFSQYHKVKYVYDFGDSWEHLIEFEGEVNSNVFLPTYVNGNGERPPEDVGGAWGYEEFLKVMSNKDDPNYESMSAWAEEQKERKFSKEKMNERLKRVISSYGFSAY